MNLEIRLATTEEVDTFYRRSTRVLGGHITDEEIPRHKAFLEIDRTLIAYDNGKIVGGTTSYPYEVSVPGASLPVASVAWVTVQPTHRRRGILTALMERQLEGIHQKGSPLAALWSSESIIYGRFGFGIGTVRERWSIDRRHTAFASEPEQRGQVEFAESDEVLKHFPDVYQRVFDERPGMMARNEALWRDRLWQHEDSIRRGNGAFCAAYEVDGRVTGYIFYIVNMSTRTLNVRELVGASDEASAALWKFCLNVDLINTVEAGNRPPDDPLPWMLADPRRLRRTSSDGVWLRLVDVAAALSARRYAEEGSLVLEVEDRTCPWNARRFALSGGPNWAECRPTNAAPNLMLTAADLGAVYLGATQFCTLNSAGRVREETSGAVDRADAMFATARQPWCVLDF